MKADLVALADRILRHSHDGCAADCLSCGEVNTLAKELKEKLATIEGVIMRRVPLLPDWSSEFDESQ